MNKQELAKERKAFKSCVDFLVSDKKKEIFKLQAILAVFYF